MASVLSALACCAAALAQGVYSTTVTPRMDDNIMSPCQYELTIPQTNVAVRAILVMFDRGREVADLYNDPAVFHFAERERLALLLARHCRSKDGEDIDADPAHGLGRALFIAIEKLGAASNHGEVQTGKAIVLGFSVAGALAARLPEFAPDRVLAAIDYAPGQDGTLGMDTVRLSPAAAAIPQLIVANSADTVNGTKRPLDYFERYFNAGAPWVLAIQNGVPQDGGLDNIKPLMFAWISEILNATPESTGVTALVQGHRGGSWLYLQTAPAGMEDAWKQTVLHTVDARIEKPGSGLPPNYTAAGWVSTRKMASEWLAFMKKPRHPVNAKYP